MKKQFSVQRMTITAVMLAVGMSVGLFMVLPAFIAGLLGPYIQNTALLNLVEGIVRMVIFVSYMLLVSRMKEMRRVFAYHGAEHKTIRCYEAGLPLTVENVRKQPCHHPRCGTSFLFVILILSILVNSLISWENLALRVVLKVLLLPVKMVHITTLFLTKKA